MFKHIDTTIKVTPVIPIANDGISKPKSKSQDSKIKNLNILIIREFEKEGKRTDFVLAFSVKESHLVSSGKLIDLPLELTKLLTQFVDVTPAELPNELPPMRDPKRYRFSPPCSQLSNLPYYNMNLRQHAKLNLEIEGAAEER